MATQDMHRDEWLNDGEEQMQAEDAVWEAAYARHKDMFLALHDSACAEIGAGATETEDERGLEAEAKLLLAVKLYETGRVTTGMAARLAGMDRVSFMFELDRFGLSPIGVDACELEQDLAKA